MDIGFIGAGRMGTALASLFVGVGHRVVLSNSRAPSSLDGLVGRLGPLARAARPAGAVAAAHVIVLATRWGQTADAVTGLGPWAGKVVIDTTNNRFGPGPDDVFDLGGQTSSEFVAALLPGARVVKAFNHQPITSLTAELGDAAAGAEPRALFVAGDDPAAKLQVCALIRDIGGEPFDTGSLRDGGLLQGSGSGPLAGHGRLLTATEARARLAAARSTGAG